MGFLQNIFRKKPEGNNALGFMQVENADVFTLDDYKESLNTVTVNLKKSTGVSFDGLKSRVKLVLDYSGSMDDLYRGGVVQRVITKLLPLALKFDDDGALECYLFSNGYKAIKNCTENNYMNYVSSVVENSGFRMGGTEYAPVLRAIHKKDSSKIPTFTIFITDGDNSDKCETDNIIREISRDNGFIMFVGIGYDNFNYLRRLDELAGRPVDNTGFVKFDNIADVNERTLYTELLSEYAAWLKNNG